MSGATVRLLEQIEGPLERVTRDGGYYSLACYEAIEERQARAVIPPWRGARIQQHGNCSQPALARDEHVRRIRKMGGNRWKQESGYHRRSLVKTTFARLKGRIGEKFNALVSKSGCGKPHPLCRSQQGDGAGNAPNCRILTTILRQSSQCLSHFSIRAVSFFKPVQKAQCIPTLLSSS
jgi:hypothetical protein